MLGIIKVGVSLKGCKLLLILFSGCCGTFGLVIFLFYYVLGGSEIGLISCLFYGLFNLLIGVFYTGFLGGY